MTMSYELNDELVERLRAKYTNMAMQVGKATFSQDDSGGNAEAQGVLPNVVDGPASSDQARICGLCQGEGIIKYEYNFRAMSKTCETCDGEGLVNRRKCVDSNDGKESANRFRKGATSRVMSQKQRERVMALRSQISRLEKKIGELEAEKMHHENSQLDSESEQTVCLLKSLISALDKSLSTLYKSKRDREDHLSYYDNMVQPSLDELSV